MIAFWNRKEVFIGISMKKFSEAREKLAANKIRYKMAVVNPNLHDSSSRRGHFGSFGERMELSNTYYIYVHKKDYEKAVFLLRSIHE